MHRRLGRDTGYQRAVCNFKGRVLIRTESRDYLHITRMQSSAGPPAPGWAEPAGREREAAIPLGRE